MSALPDLAAVKANLAFTCVHEADHLPPLPADADELFRYARYKERATLYKDLAQSNAIARYYRIAAAHGHYRANHSLQRLVSEGEADSAGVGRATEVVALAEQLIRDGIPGGYYDMGRYLELGYGVKADTEKSLRYYRKAADLGSPDAQYVVADKLTDAKDAEAFAIGVQMYRCAAEQGHGDAANFLGVLLQDIGDGSAGKDADNAKAAIAFQIAAAAGNDKAASTLEEAFQAAPRGSLGHLDLPNDPERSHRYKLIGKLMYDYGNFHPTVPDIDRIVPLPPAPLPPWDGTFQWLREHNAPPPAPPSDELIERLSREKHLDPATGAPIPPPAKAALGTRVNTGERCPDDGIWCAYFDDGIRAPKYFAFRQGQTLPTYDRYRPRRVELLDALLGHRYDPVAVSWELLRYTDDT